MAENSSKTYIAAFGTQALAKATDLRAYTLSKDVGDKPGGYSARGFCMRVLAAEAPRLGIDLGVTGREPLNNQPFFWVTYMDEAFSRVKGDAKDAYALLVKTLKELNNISDETQAREILRAFLRLRLKEERSAPDVATEGLTPSKVYTLAEEFVASESEGGRRAQAMAAALLDASFGLERVRTGRINDPDRKFPGDIAVFERPEATIPELAIEVRDKPVKVSDIFHFVRNVSESGISRAVVTAVSSAQNPELRDAVQGDSEVRAFAHERGVGLLLYLNWWSLGSDFAFWSNRAPIDFAESAFKRLLERAIELELSEAAIDWWVSHAGSTEANAGRAPSAGSDEGSG